MSPTTEQRAEELELANDTVHQLPALGSASRAVGGALGRNPVPIIVPCHRVITWKGLLGGYAHGLFAKRALLQLEGQNLKVVG